MTGIAPRSELPSVEAKGRSMKARNRDLQNGGASSLQLAETLAASATPAAGKAVPAGEPAPVSLVERTMTGKTSALILAILVGIAALLICGTYTNGQNWGDDFASYIMQARSIVVGAPRAFIAANRYTIENSSFTLGPVAYPWGYPALLAPIYAVFGMNLLALKSVGMISFLLFLVVLWLGFRRRHSPFWLVCLVGLFALNPTLIEATDSVLSDVPFLLFSTFSVFLIGRVMAEKRPLLSPTWDPLLVGLSIAGAYFIRTNGILLLGALAAAQFLGLFVRSGNGASVNGKSVKWFWGLLAPYVCFFAAAVLVEMALPAGGATHLQYMKRVSLQLVRENLSFHLKLPSAFFVGVPQFALLYGMTIPFAIAGILRRFRSDAHVLVYFALTFLLYVVWPEPQGLRFLFPVLPFYISFVLTGLEILDEGAANGERAWRKMLCRASLLLVLGFFVIRSMENAYDNLAAQRKTTIGPYVASSQEMFSFISRQTEPESRIVFFKPRAMRMLTDRKSLALQDGAALAAGDYVCLNLTAKDGDQVSNELIGRLADRGAARVVFANSDFKVYRISNGINTP
jgi:hypothetical protein